MKIIKKGLALLLTAALVITMVPAASVFAAGGSSAAGGDAFAALGIDTGAPEGFDENSLDNPYGRDTIKVNTVSELYTVGLDNWIPNTVASKDAGTGQATADRKTYQHPQVASNVSMKASLYGDGTGVPSVGSALTGTAISKNISASNITATANYIRLNKAGSTRTYTKNEETGAETWGNYSYTDYRTGLNNISSEQGVMSDVAAGNFDGNKTGKSAQIAMVYTKEYSAKGGLYLKFGDAKAGGYGNTNIELLSKNKVLGNPNLKLENEDGSTSDKNAENFADNPYQLKNYLQVATGDWNGDGIDEVAVYVPEVGKSRIEVYALQKSMTDADDIYKQANKWRVAWTYNLEEGDVVSNMISLTSGDVDRDGIDDLACTWGYYYGPKQNKGSKAVVMFGGKGTDLLKRSQQFDITYGTSNIVRASFAFGDIGMGEETLILCGQADSDLRSDNPYSRYVALYKWNGESFTSSIANNFRFFEKDKDGNLIYNAFSKHDEKFYSLPLCPANTAIINKGISDEGSNKLYFDSLVFTYGDGGLNIALALDKEGKMPGSNGKEYVEYDGTSGDMTGITGAGALMTVTQTVSTTVDKIVSYTEQGPQEVDVYETQYYYKNWFYKLIKKKHSRQVYKGRQLVTANAKVDQNYSETSWGKTNMVVYSPSDNSGWHETLVNPSFSLCLANTDNDSSYMNYAGKHYYRYSDPKVLAVLASPPYFKDLLNRDDLSGNYAESTTSYATSTGKGTGSQGSTTISVGAYVSFEQEISVFGVKIGQVEAETVVKSGFTWETEKTSEIEQTVSYSATSGENKVALYSIPMEIYKYESYVPDAKGNYKKVITEVNIPHEASIKLLDLSEYETIAKDYSILPTVADTVLKHKIGDPSTYPSSTKGYSVIAEYNGTPASVGYTSKDGGDAISQEIAMTKSKSNVYSYERSIEAKAGAGAGGVTVGIVAGFEGSGGKVSISTEGSSFSGELQAMPVEAEAYGYAMNWRIFSYKYKDSKMEFPVVSYVVSDVAQPKGLPEDFEQDVAETTDKSVTLKWSYDKDYPVAGFQIYKYHEFPDGSGSQRLEYVPFSTGKLNQSEGKYEFSFTDTGLSPYTEYKYQIQTESNNRPKVSIYSEPLVCRTKTTMGYPDLTLDGLDSDGRLPIYPDSEGKVTVSTADADKYNSISYQWQRYSDGKWKNLYNKTNTLKITNASATDNGIYRCLANVIYFDATSQKEFAISAYTDSFETRYTKRDSKGILTAQQTNDAKGIEASVELYSGNKGNSTAPSGTVTFTFEGKDCKYEETVLLEKAPAAKTFDGENKLYATAKSTQTGLPEGAYTVKYYYSGDKVFKDMSSEAQTVCIGSGQNYLLDLMNASNTSATRFIYEDIITPVLREAKLGSNNKTEVNDVDESKVEYKTYRITTVNNKEEIGTVPITAENLDVGKYIIYAYLKDDGNAVQTEPVAEVRFTVEKKLLVVTADRTDNIGESEVDTNTPKFTVTKDSNDQTPEVSENFVTALGITYKAYNTAGKPVNESTEGSINPNEGKLVNGMLPGNYTVVPCYSDTEDDTIKQQRANYEVTFISGIYTIVGQKYELEAIAAPFEESGELKTAGTVAIAEANGVAKGQFTRGTKVQIFASPNSGYEVDKWQITTKDANGTTDKTETTADSMIQQGQNPNILAHEMDAKNTTITVSYKIKSTKLHTIPPVGGTIECVTVPNFTSGGVVSPGAMFEFKATPEIGYSFKYWEITSTGSIEFADGTTNSDRTNTVFVTMGTDTKTLKAVFIRDKYAVTLDQYVSAYYMADTTESGQPVKTYIKTGDKVTGDTQIYVQPKAGYQAKDGAKIQKNGETLEADEQGICNFKLTEDTNLTLEAELLKFSVKAVADMNGSVSIKANNEEVTSDAELDGGSRVVLTPRASRGYVFDHWEAKEGENYQPVAGEEVYTVEELNAQIDMKAVFRANEARTVKIDSSPASRGVLNYTVYDIYGEPVSDDEITKVGNDISVYEGETISFEAAPNAGSMVEQWVFDNDTDDSLQPVIITDPAISYPDGSIRIGKKNISMKVVFNAMVYYTLYFNAEHGGSVSAEADGTPTESGKVIPGGTKLSFTATPDSGKMVDYWTINGETVNDNYGLPMVDENYEIPAFSGDKTVKVYFRDAEYKGITVNDGSKADVTVAEKTFVTGQTEALAVRNGGTVKLTIKPKDGYATSAESLEKVFTNSDWSLDPVTYAAGGYTVVLRGVNADIDINLNDCVDELVTIINSSSNGTISDISAVPAADGQPADKVRKGAEVTFKLAPKSGYQIDKDKLSGAEVVINNDRTATVKINNIQNDFTIDNSVFAPIPSGGGGGGAAPVPPEQKPEEDDNKIIVEDTVDSDGQKITQIIVKAETLKSKDEKSVELQLSDEQKKALIEKAIDKNADTIIITNDELNDETEKLSDIINVNLDVKLLNEIISKTNATVAVETPVGFVKFNKDALKAVEKQQGKAKSLKLQLKIEKDKDYSHIIGKTAYVISVKLLADKEAIIDFGDGRVEITLEIPNTLLGRELVAVYIGEKDRIERFDGKIITKKSADKNGKETETKYYSFETSHFSVYALAEKSKVDEYEKTQKNQKLISGVKKTTVKLSSTASKKKIKLSWKKSKGYKVDAYEVYRKTSKSGKYTKVFTTKKPVSLSWTNSKKLKSGKTYYYKVRGVRTVDGNKYYTKWSNITSKKIK